MTREEAVRRINRAAEENLTELDLAGLELEELPQEIGKCTQLEMLVLGKVDQEKRELVGNKLTEFPDVVFQLTSLKILSIVDNQITVIPEAIGLLSNLTQLDLSNNQITVIPEAIGQLSNLTRLDLDNNQITVIPEAIGQLSNLTQLVLGSNQITVIPEAIGLLSNLTLLFLSDNQITVIPEAIGQLSNLTQLNLSNNQITVIPECLETLPKLKQLGLRHNPLPISPEVLGNRVEPAAIFNYLQKLRSGEVRPLNEAKVLLVGQGSVGKTSLINRLTHNKYNPNESQTDGLNITDWQITVNTKSVKLNVWDFGGQEIYHATNFSLPNAASTSWYATAAPAKTKTASNTG